jgi:hypothetical protein
LVMLVDFKLDIEHELNEFESSFEHEWIERDLI